MEQEVAPVMLAQWTDVASATSNGEAVLVVNMRGVTQQGRPAATGHVLVPLTLAHMLVRQLETHLAKHPTPELLRSTTSRSN